MMAQSEKNKHPVAMIIRKITLGGEPHEEMTEKKKTEDDAEVDDDMAYQTASEEILDAIHAKDAAALKHALHSFIEMCMDHEASETPEEEAAEHEE